MNFVEKNRSRQCVKRLLEVTIFVVLAVALAHITGCAGDRMTASTPKELSAFKQAGPVAPEVDMEKIKKARIHTGPYRVIAGDLLELQIPAVLQTVTSESPAPTARRGPLSVRVNQKGEINLPIIGKLKVAGKTLSEVEQLAVDKYYPEYVVNIPSIVAQIAEYKTYNVSVTGAVKKPGVYEMRHDRMTLASLLTKAGGIVEAGAARIQIVHQTGSKRGTGPNLSGESKNTKSLQAAPAYSETNPHTVAAMSESSGGGSGNSQVDDNHRMAEQYELSFIQSESSSTTGLLVVEHQGSRILAERLDVTDVVQRQKMARKLARKEPNIASEQIIRRLSTLEQTLQSPQGGGEAKSSPTVKEATSDRQDLQSQNSSKVSGNNKLDPLDILEGQMKETKVDGTKERKVSKPIVLPVKGLDIPFADVQLREGDRVEIERLMPKEFAVIGLVNRPGAFPYKPGAEYTLAQALAHAGGLDRISEPRYVNVYRQNSDGKIVSAVFNVKKDFKDTVDLEIKPGDVIAVQETPRTRRNLILSEIININTGIYVRPQDFWGEN